MRFLELHLRAYGPFTDYSIDLSENSFHLIFGRNEAGKSTTLRAIDAMLFGIPSRTPDSFLHKYAELKVGARIENQQGRELGFLRLKRNKKSLTCLDEFKKTLPENSLDDFLKGMDRDRFRRLYCIDHDEFRSGGELMRDLKGLANDSLIAASHGGGFSDVGKVLLEEAEALWSPKKRATSIKKLIDEVGEAKKERTNHAARVAEWKAINDELEKLQQQKEEVVEDSTRLKSKQHRLKRLQEALPLVAQWSSLNTQLAEHGEVKILPDAYSPEERIRCMADLASRTEQHNSLDAKISVLDGDIATADKLPEVLRASEQIDSLQRRIESYRESCEQLSGYQRQMELASQAMGTKLNDLGWSLSVEQVTAQLGAPTLQSKESDFDNPDSSTTSIVVRSEVRAAINELIPEEQQIRERPQQLEQERRLSEQELEEIDSRLNNLGQEIDSSSFEFAVREASQYLRLEQTITELREELKNNQKRSQRALAQLPGWSGSLKELIGRTVPLRETVDHFRQQYATLDNKSDTLDAQRKATNTELLQTREKIAATQRASSVVTENDLAASRAERDLGWQLIKRTKLQGNEDAAAVQQFAGPKSLEDAYEHTVDASDEIADRLRREAQRVGELTQQQERETRLGQELESIEAEAKQLASDRMKLDDDWENIWNKVGIADARSPREMLAWLDLYDTIIEQSAAADDIQTQLENSQNQQAEQTKALSKAIAAFNGDGGALDSLARLHARAESMLQDYRSQEVERDQLMRDRLRLRRKVEASDSAIKAANQELQKWNTRWRKAMESIGCEANYTGSQAMARLSSLDALRAASEDWLTAKEREQQARERIVAFESDVKTLLRLLDHSDRELPPIDVANRLQERLQESRSLQQADQQRRNRRKELARELETLMGEIESLRTHLAQFCSMAGIDSVEGLDKIEFASGLASQKGKVDDELRRISGGEEFEQFVQEAAEADIDDLAAQISLLDAEVAETATKRDGIVAEITAAKVRRDEFDGSDEAAIADQRAMNCLSKIHTNTRRYLTLRIAESILRQQVERYRDENRDPLLSRASQYFAEMTCNEFSGLESDYDDDGQPIIVALRRNGESVLTSALSDGTLDPLFLSLRLAYLYDKVTLFEPMPLVVDDILIHLDDERASATMKVLAEFSRHTQVLFFTHHQRLRELAESTLATDLLTVHEIERVGVERKTRPR